MAGTKTITNTSNVAISVVLRGRIGADPSSGSLPPVSAQVAANSSATLQYGDDNNPFLNSLQVEENSNGSDISATFSCLQRGGPGTLDNMLNTNSTIMVSYNAATFGFAISV